VASCKYRKETEKKEKQYKKEDRNNTKNTEYTKYKQKYKTNDKHKKNITTPKLGIPHYCAGNNIEKNEMGWACGAYG